jgi:hypothetical protein
MLTQYTTTLKRVGNEELTAVLKTAGVRTKLKVLSRTEKYLCSQPNMLKKRDFSTAFYGIMLQIIFLPDEFPVKLSRRRKAVYCRGGETAL